MSRDDIQSGLAILRQSFAERLDKIEGQIKTQSKISLGSSLTASGGGASADSFGPAVGRERTDSRDTADSSPRDGRRGFRAEPPWAAEPPTLSRGAGKNVSFTTPDMVRNSILRATR